MTDPQPTYSEVLVTGERISELIMGLMAALQIMGATRTEAVAALLGAAGWQTSPTPQPSPEDLSRFTQEGAQWAVLWWTPAVDEKGRVQ